MSRKRQLSGGKAVKARREGAESVTSGSVSKSAMRSILQTAPEWWRRPSWHFRSIVRETAKTQMTPGWKARNHILEALTGKERKC